MACHSIDTYAMILTLKFVPIFKQCSKEIMAKSFAIDSVQKNTQTLSINIWMAWKWLNAFSRLLERLVGNARYISLDFMLKSNECNTLNVFISYACTQLILGLVSLVLISSHPLHAMLFYEQTQFISLAFAIKALSTLTPSEWTAC